MKKEKTLNHKFFVCLFWGGVMSFVSLLRQESLKPDENTRSTDSPNISYSGRM